MKADTEQARAQQAAEYADDILILGPSITAREAARRAGIPTCVALRILVPYHQQRGLPIPAIATALRVSRRTVERHQAIARRHPAQVAA